MSYTPLRSSDDESKIQRSLPASPEAEQGLLGALLLQNTLYHEVAGFLHEEHFSEAVHGRLYDTIGKLISRGQNANPFSLKALFDHDTTLASLGGAGYLYKLVESVVTLANAEDYGHHIQEMFVRRQLIHAGEQLVEDAYKIDLDRPTCRILADHAISLGETTPPNLNSVIDVSEDDGLIEPRGWLLGNTFCRRFVSGLLAQGAAGKTALRIAQALAVASGQDLTGEYVFHRGRVLIICLEDGVDELRRRVRAAMLHYGITREDLAGGWLYIWTPSGMKIAKQTNKFARDVVPGDLEPQLRRFIIDHRIDLVILDPLIKAHSADENDNTALDAVASILTHLAEDLNCAVDCLHHERKPNGTTEPGDSNRGRGASSFRDANRLVYTLTPMTEAEREEFGISEAEQVDLVRLDRSKTNLTKKTKDAAWYKFVGVPINNGTELYPHGDTVPTVERWYPPRSSKKLTKEGAATVFDIFRQSPEPDEFWLWTAKANGDWAGNVIVSKLGMNMREAKRLLDDWKDNGVLVTEDYFSPKRKKIMTRVTIVESKAAEILGSLYHGDDRDC